MGEGCTACLAFELQPENVLPTHKDAQLFAKPQWCSRITLPYVIYRIVTAILMTTWVIADIIQEASNWYAHNYMLWFLLATNWSLLFVAVSSVISATLTTFYFVQSKVECTDLPKGPANMVLMVQWILYTIAANGALVVSLSFWGFLWSSDDSGFLVTTMSQLKHTLNSIYVIIDLLIIAIPIRVFHLVWPLGVGALYTIFNATYFTHNGIGPEGKPYAYYVMDWRNPIESSLTCAAGFILTTLVQGVLYAVFRFRMFLYWRVREYFEDFDDTAQFVSRMEPGPEERAILHQDGRARTSSYSSTASLEHLELGHTLSDDSSS